MSPREESFGRALWAGFVALVAMVAVGMIALAFGAEASEADDWYYTGINQISPPQFYSSDEKPKLVVFDIPNWRAGTIVQQLVPRACKKWAQLGHPEWADLPEIPDDAIVIAPPHKSTDFAKGRMAYSVSVLTPNTRGWRCWRQPSVQTLYEEGAE